MNVRRLAGLLFVVGAWIALGTVAPAQTAAPKITMAGYPSAGQPATVTVLSTGAAPKKALRYNIPADFKGRLDITTSMAMSMSVMGQPTDMPVPAIKLGVDLAVTSVAANGDVTYTLAFTGMTLDGDASSPLAVMLQGATAGITTVKGTTTMTSRGIPKTSNLDVADPSTKVMLDQMNSSIENLTTAFPEEAVGVGARWEVKTAITGGGQTQFQKAIYEITAFDASAVSLKVTTETTAPPQTIDNPMAAAVGGEMKLDKMTGSGVGTMTVHLDALAPTSSIDQTTSMAMTMTIQGQAVPVTANGKISIAVAPIKRQ